MESSKFQKQSSLLRESMSVIQLKFALLPVNDSSLNVLIFMWVVHVGSDSDRQNSD